MVELKYTSNSYKRQKEFMEGLEIRCNDIDEEIIERVKRELKSMKFWGQFYQSALGRIRIVILRRKLFLLKITSSFV